VQEVDIVSIVKPITKYPVVVLDPLDIRFELEKAHYLALNGRPGPVWIDIPLDVSGLADPRSVNAARFDASEYKAAMANANLEDEVRRVVEELQRSTRPLLFAGNGTRLARAEKQFNELRLLLDVPRSPLGARPISFLRMCPRSSGVLEMSLLVAQLRAAELRLSARPWSSSGHGDHRLRSPEIWPARPTGCRGYRPFRATEAPPASATANHLGLRRLPRRVARQLKALKQPLDRRALGMTWNKRAADLRRRG